MLLPKARSEKYCFLSFVISLLLLAILRTNVFHLKGLAPLFIVIGITLLALIITLFLAIKNILNWDRFITRAIFIIIGLVTLGLSFETLNELNTAILLAKIGFR